MCCVGGTVGTGVAGVDIWAPKPLQVAACVSTVHTQAGKSLSVLAGNVFKTSKKSTEGFFSIRVTDNGSFH